MQDAFFPGIRSTGSGCRGEWRLLSLPNRLVGVILLLRSPQCSLSSPSCRGFLLLTQSSLPFAHPSVLVASGRPSFRLPTHQKVFIFNLLSILRAWSTWVSQECSASVFRVSPFNRAPPLQLKGGRGYSCPSANGNLIKPVEDPMPCNPENLTFVRSHYGKCLELFTSCLGYP